MLTIEKILRKKNMKLWSIGPNETAYKALEIMADKDIGSLLVIDKGELVGIFTERDYSRKVILKGKSSKDTKVEDLMTRKVITVKPENTIDECMALMKAANCRHMPVFEKGRLVAIVTMRDIMNELISEKDILI
ncbi:MAG: CBS domain-containing protein, partial [Nitrospirota bacterium]|nr:CBS domain-containing protein [Nitrospirota bacterium]